MSRKPADPDAEMLPGYDFSGGVRGKYYDEYQKGTNVVLLEPDLARVSHNSATVNEMEQIPEADWKLWRGLREQALERFSQNALAEFAAVKDGEGTSHERYLKVYQLLEERDVKLGEIFNGPKRSNAFFQIALAAHALLITPEEIAKFSEETQSVIALLSGLDG